MTTSPADVLITYLEMTAATEHRPARPMPSGVQLHEVPRADAAAMAMEMYRRVGEPWHWTDRRDWSVADWRGEMDRHDAELWTACDGNIVTGYFQLQRVGSDVAIRYFGLLPEHLGRGIGGPLLSAAIDRCWSMHASRIILNTCTLDHPRALPNYLARGFSIAGTRTREYPA